MNQRSPEKQLIQLWVSKELLQQLDEYVEGYETTRTEAIVGMITRTLNPPAPVIVGHSHVESRPISPIKSTVVSNFSMGRAAPKPAKKR